jgi:hypothetical protein
MESGEERSATRIVQRRPRARMASRVVVESVLRWGELVVVLFGVGDLWFLGACSVGLDGVPGLR